MTPQKSPQWLSTTVAAVRELMVKRLDSVPPGGESRREMEMALEELDAMWEELQGQAALLVRENRRYAEFFEYSPDAYLITDAGGNIREVNQAALELLRSPRDELVGRPLSDCVAAEDREQFLARAVYPMLDAGGEPASWRARMIAAQGTALDCELSVRAIPLKKSGVGGLCWLVRRG